MKLNTHKIERELFRLNMTKRELAERLKVSRQALWDMLRRESVTLATVNRLGSALDVDPKDLLI